MSYTRTLILPAPAAASGQRWVASALLEARDVNGQPGEFAAIEAYTGAPGSFSTRHAQHETGWYRVQWYDDAKASLFSEPVRLTGDVAANSGGQDFSYGGGR